MNLKNGWIALFVFCLLLSLGVQSHAQSRSAEINGVVADAQNAVIPDATVAVTNTATGVLLSTKTNSAGLYGFQALTPGSYRIEVSKTGFTTFVRTGFVIEVGQIARVDAVLQVGATKETVQVQATAPVLQTQSAEAGLTVNQRELNNLPILDRNMLSLFELNASVDMKSSYPMQGQTWSNLAQYTNGSTEDLRTDSGAPTVQSVAPTTDVVAEYRTLYNSFSPEFRGVTAFVVETKSGTNQIHGTGYFWARDQALNAKPWGAPTKLPFKRTEPGFTLGGPIQKDKLFFFVAYERFSQDSSLPVLLTVPTMLQRQGDFSQTFAANGNLIPIYDPSSTVIGSNGQVTRTLFPGNIIPPNQIDPVGQKIINYYPHPNLLGASPNFTGPHNFTYTQWQPNVRIDYFWSARNRSYGSFLSTEPTWQDRFPYGALGVFGDDNGSQPQKVYTFGHIYTPSPSWVLTTTFSALARHWQQVSTLPSGNQGYPGMVGLTGTVPGSGFFPTVTVAGYSQIPGGTGWADSGVQFYNRAYSFAQRFVHSPGKQTLKFGVEMQPSRTAAQFRPSPSGNFSFGNQPTALNGVGGNALAALLVGFPISATIADQAPLKFATSYYGAYFNDDWRMRKNLTLSLGLRWETDSPEHIRNVATNVLNLTSFNPTAINPVSGTPGIITYPGINGPDGAYPQDWKQFGPRVGIAWQLSPKMVVRAGGGIFYQTVWDGAGFSTWQPPAYGLPGYLSGSFVSPDNGITAPFLLQQGIPPAPATQPGPGFGAVPVGQNPTLSVVYPGNDGYRPGYNTDYNLTVQRTLRGDFEFEIGYIGNLGRRLTGSLNMNQVPPALFGPGNAQVRRPFPQYSGVTNALFAGFISNYHAIEVKVRKRYSNGLTLLSSYNYGLTFADRGPYNSYDIRASYGPSGVRNNWVTSFVYELPWGHGQRWLQKGPISAILGGWEEAGIAQVQSGQYLSVTSVSNTTNGFMTQGVNIVSNPSGPKTMAEWFNTSAFTQPAPYTLGNAGHGIVIGPGSFNFDDSLIKVIRINERFSTEIHVDMLDILNHPVLQNPNTTLGSPGFGSIPGKTTATYSPGNAIAGFVGNRQIQLGIKLLF